MKNMIHKQFEAVAESGDQQIVGGFITTGNRDRHGDIVEPKGVDTEHLQLLLENHDHTAVAGRLIDVEHRPEGVYARFKVLVDDVWQKVKSGMYGGFSIGFLPKEAEPLKDGGWLYKSVEVLETSICSVISNRESQILEVRNYAPEGNFMSDSATAPVGNVVKRVSPAVHTEKHEYSLQRALKGVLENRTPTGLEGETDAELRHQQPWREFGGCAIPLEQIFLSSQQRAELDAKIRASGVVNPTNLAPLVGEEYRDELFAYIDDAIANQLLSGRVGVRTLTGLQEQTVRVPRMDAMMSAGHVLLDADLPASSDPTFTNQTLTPKLVGSVAQLNLSSILAQHPRVGTDFIGNELRRALTQEVERVFLAGDNSGTPAEPDGLVNLSDDTGSLAIATATIVADTNTAAKAIRDYTQSEDGQTWIWPPELLEAAEVVESFTGSTVSGAQAIREKMLNIQNAYALPETTGTYTGFVGDFSYIVHGMWQAAEVTLNPFADSVFPSKATLLRVSMLHDYQAIDNNRVKSLAITP